MLNWEDLTPVQADAVIATAIAHDLDPDKLLRRLAPLLTDEPTVPLLPAKPPVSNVVEPTTNPILINPEEEGQWPWSR